VSRQAISSQEWWSTPLLTVREREIAQLIARGYSNHQIAEELVIASSTAERHVANILTKLRAHSRAEIAAWAVQRRLLELPAGGPEAALMTPIPIASRPSSNLAADSTSFVGRERELRELMLLLPTNRLVSLIGPGGVGKSRLAKQVARASASAYRDGVWLTELAPLSNSGDVVSAVVAALGLVQHSSLDIQQTLAEQLRLKRLLLVLDNCEHLVQDCAEIVRHLARACPDVHVLITSREPLRLREEQLFPVPPLQLPPSDRAADAPSLLEAASVKLFAQRAAQVVPEFDVTTDNARIVADICIRLDGLPLAIELAAPRLAVLSPAALLERLQHRLDVLVGGARDLPARQRTLYDTIGWSYGLLTPAEQDLFRQLAVFTGGCSLQAAEALAHAHVDVPGSVLDGLASLVSKQLVRRQADLDGEPWFVMLETIREFALERLTATGEADLIRRRHADHFITLGERAANELSAGPKHAHWIRRLGRDRHNLRAALHWCVRNREVDRGLKLGSAVWRFWYLEGSRGEVRDWLEALLRLLPAASSSTLGASALNGAGVLASHLDDYSKARELHEKSLTIGRKLGNHARIAASLHNLGMLAVREGDLQSARTLIEEGIAYARASADRGREALGLNALGTVLAEVGEYQTACARHADSAVVYSDLGDVAGVASARSRQGIAALAGGNRATALALCEEGLQYAHESGQDSQIAWSSLNLAYVRLDQGDYRIAQELFARSLKLVNDIAYVGTRVALALKGLASIAAVHSQPEHALHLFGAAAAFEAGKWHSVYATPVMGLHLISTHQWESMATAAIGEQQARTALLAGSGLSTQQAIAYALEFAADWRATARVVAARLRRP
jgi:predicted ATPase/DNA-binding CsgD family transcriptional regulator